MGANAVLFTKNIFNYASATVRRNYFDSVYVDMDTVYALVPDNVTKGSIMICNRSENYGTIAARVAIIDKSLTPPAFLDINQGTIDSTVAFGSFYQFGIDSLEVCGTCPAITLTSSSCSGDSIYCSAVAKRKFDQYVFFLNDSVIQSGPSEVLQSGIIANYGDTLMVQATSENTPCNYVVSLPFVVKQKDSVFITIDTLTSSYTLTGHGAVAYKWYTDSLLNSTSSISVSSPFTTSYKLVATDHNACISVLTTTINQPLEVTYTSVNTTSTDPYSGEIQLIVTGGKPPYRFNWDSGFNTPNLKRLSKGIYSVTVSDANKVKIENIIIIE